MKVRFFLFVSVVLLSLSTFRMFGQGSLTPPPEALSNGSPIPFMKTLDQVEPRKPIKELPYAINESGSYYLTTTLHGDAGLTIKANDVKVDLGGFAIEGQGGESSGIIIEGAYHNIHILNGVVRGWGQAGINGANATGCRYEGITASANNANGLVVGANSTIIDCGAFDNNGQGIVAGIGATVASCKARANGSTGIVVSAGSRISNCLSGNNASAGIALGASSIAKSCIATGNGADGVVVSKKCRVTENNCTENINSAGILITGSGNIVSGNSVAANKFGIRADDQDAIHNLIIRNHASENENNYAINIEVNTSGGRYSGSDIPNTLGSWTNFDL